MKKKLKEKDIESIFEENKKLKEENKSNAGDGLAGKLKTKITDLPLRIRTMNLLKALDCDTLGDIVTKDQLYFMQFRSFGAGEIYEIMTVLELYDLDFGMDVK